MFGSRKAKYMKCKNKIPCPHNIDTENVNPKDS
jgi:hypothetical protein